MTSALWGVQLHGLSLPELHRTRVCALKSLGRVAAGTAVGIKLTLLDKHAVADPVALATRCVVQMWAQAVWNGALQEDLMETCLAEARGAFNKKVPDASPVFLATLAGKAKTRSVEIQWGQAKNPARVLLATLWRIGWQAPSASTLRAPDGTILDLEACTEGRCKSSSPHN